VLAGWAFVYGLLDRLTWGHWFHSAAVYLRFNLLEHGAEAFGRSAPSFYTSRLLASLGPLWVTIAILAVLAAARSPGLWLVALFFWVPHWLAPHKELRFMFPLLAPLCGLAGVGLEVLRDSGKAFLWKLSIFLVAGSIAYSFVTWRQLTFKQLGVPVKDGRATAFDDGGSENRLLFKAHDAADLCGLKVTTRHLAYVGGFAYLHRPVPLYDALGPPEGSHRFNYVIGARGAVLGRIVASDGERVLARVFDGGCQPDAAYNWHLK
jgi:hypothetical protein